MSDIFQIPAYITEIKANARMSLRIKVETVEALSGDSMQRFFALIDKPGYFLFASRQIESDDILDLPMPNNDRKSKSTIMREVLWHNWNQNSMGHQEFEDYYNFMMDHIINKLKAKLS